MVIKLSLLIIFLATFIFETGWSVYCMKIYRDKVADVKASSLFPSRSEIQVFQTHSHFFLFTGMMAAGAVAVGIWGILMEYLVIIVGYCYIHTVCTLFEVIGAYFSEDDQVAKYKVFGVFPEPFLIMFGLIFAHMVRVGEREMASSPLYKQKLAARAGKGETQAYIAPSSGIEEKRSDKKIMSTRSPGMINQGLDLSEEEHVSKMADENDGDDRRQPSPSSSGNSSSRSRGGDGGHGEVSVTNNTVTVSIEQ